MFNPNNPIFNQMFGGFGNFKMNFNNFANSFSQGMTPDCVQQQAQMRVQQMLNSGQMSQQQFEQFRQIANAITGMNR